LTTIGKPDPVSELNNELWNSGTDANKNVAREQKRRLSYIVNVLVVQDPSNPANEGKVKLFKFGKKIFDKIKDAMQPEFPGEEPVNPFDFWKGANFKLKIRNVEGYRNYDKSEFEPVSVLSDDDAKIETIWGQQYSLVDFLDARHFKSYEELKKKLEGVLSGVPAAVRHAESVDLDAPVAAAKPAPVSVAKEPALEEDDSVSYFANLAADD
jgi:hypothetical protein